ncbi:MAG: CmcI family methyltransferase [Acidobacteriota bacterium]
MTTTVPEKYDESHSFQRFPARPFLWFLRGVIMKIPPLQRFAVDLFANIYYDSAPQTWDNMSWLGVPCQKFPSDLWIYQEIISQKRPDIVIETGTLHGGSALYLASLFDLIGHGQVVSIDLQVREDRPEHPRIHYIAGASSTSPESIRQLEPLLEGSTKRMVILDSDHRKAHVDAELGLYSKYVTADQYLVVEDSSINGHPLSCQFGPGPYESIMEFVQADDRFVVDKTKEKLLVTANTNGFLLRVK